MMPRFEDGEVHLPDDAALGDALTAWAQFAWKLLGRKAKVELDGDLDVERELFTVTARCGAFEQMFTAPWVRDPEDAAVLEEMRE